MGLLHSLAGLIVPHIKASSAALALAVNHTATHSVANWEGNHKLFCIGLAHLLHGKFGRTIKKVNKKGEHFFKAFFEKCTEDFCSDLMLNFEPGSIMRPNFLTLEKVEQESKRSTPKITKVKSNKQRKTTLSGACKSNNNGNDG